MDETLQGVGSGAATGASIGGPWGAVIGGALGLLGADKAKKNADAARQVEVAKAITNPWLHMDSSGVASPDMLGKTVGGAAQGLEAAQKYSSWQRDQQRQDAMAKGAMNRQPAVMAESQAPNSPMMQQNPWWGMPQGQGALL